MTISVPDASAEMILAAAEAVHYTRPNFDLATVAKYMRATDVTRAQEALKAAVLLGFLEDAGAGKYTSVDEVLHLEIHADNADRRILFRLRLEQFAPFRIFKERVLCGDSALEAAEKIKVLEAVETDSTKLKEIFQQWGQYADTFSLDELGRLARSSPEDPEPAYLRAVRSAIASSDQARTFVRKRLGEDYFTRLPPEAVDNLASAMSRCHAEYNPKPEIGFAIGTALEKILAAVAAAANPAVNLAGAKGPGQMAQALRTADVITSKHVGLISAVAALRNAAEHGTDNEINKEWSLTHNSLMDVALLTLDTVKSIFEWTTRKFPVI